MTPLWLGPRDASHVLIWLHGLGASQHDFIDVVPMLNRTKTAVVLPQAPTRPVTINAGYEMPAWYDIYTLEPSPEREDMEQLRASAATIESLIDQVSETRPRTQVGVIGFSQGGAVALHVALTTANPLGFCGILSGYLVRPATVLTPSIRRTQTPFFFAHGLHDEVVPMSRSHEAYQALNQRTYRCTFQTYPMGHEVCIPQIHDLAMALTDAGFL